MVETMIREQASGPKCAAFYQDSHSDTNTYALFIFWQCGVGRIPFDRISPQTLEEVRMILPRMSAALLSMSFFGSAYASAELYSGTSLDQWVVSCGAANGAAALFQAPADDLALHCHTAKSHIDRYAAENGMSLREFEPLFERGHAE